MPVADQISSRTTTGAGKLSLAPINELRMGRKALVLGVAQADITGHDAEGAPVIRLQAQRSVRVEP